MHRLVLYVVCLFVLVVSPAMRTLALDALAEADGIRLFEKGKVLGGRAKDLLEIGKQQKEPINPSEISDLDAFRQAYADLHEQTIAMTLAGEAAANADHLLSVGTLLRFYGRMSCDLDKEPLRLLLRAQMLSYAESMGDAVGLANRGLAQTRQPGVATAAARIRNDLLESKSLLESIVLR